MSHLVPVWPTFGPKPDIAGRLLTSTGVVSNMQICLLTNEIHERKYRKRKYVNIEKSGLPEHKSIFKLLISKVNYLISNAKRCFYQNDISESTSSKYLYNLVTSMYGKS